MNATIRILTITAFVILLGGVARTQLIVGLDTGLGGQNSITGMVFTPSGQRASRPISIRLQTDSKGDRITSSDDSGNFGFRGLPSGDYTLVIDKEPDCETFRTSVSVIQVRGFPAQNVLVTIRLNAKKGLVAKAAVVNADLAGVPDKALDEYKKAADLAAKDDHQGAVTLLEAAVSDYPKFALAHNDLGFQYMKLGQGDKADEQFQIALGLNHDLYPAMLNHSIILFTHRHYDEAEPLLRKLVAAKPEQAVGHYFLGQDLAFLGKFDEAEKELNTSIQIGGPDMKEAYRILAIIHASKGDKKRAAGDLEAYLKLAPSAPDAAHLQELIDQYHGVQKSDH